MQEPPPTSGDHGRNWLDGEDSSRAEAVVQPHQFYSYGPSPAADLSSEVAPGGSMATGSSESNEHLGQYEADLYGNQPDSTQGHRVDVLPCPGTLPTHARHDDDDPDGDFLYAYGSDDIPNAEHAYVKAQSSWYNDANIHDTDFQDTGDTHSSSLLSVPRHDPYAELLPLAQDAHTPTYLNTFVGHPVHSTPSFIQYKDNGGWNTIHPQGSSHHGVHATSTVADQGLIDDHMVAITAATADLALGEPKKPRSRRKATLVSQVNAAAAEQGADSELGADTTTSPLTTRRPLRRKTTQRGR